MAVIFDTSHTVIVAFIFTVVAVSVATMFLSCFGKKKDKKKGKNKGKAPSPSPHSSPSSPTQDNVKIEPKVEDKPSPEDRVAAEGDDLGDFSAVQRETEILRSEINDESSLQLSFMSQQDPAEREEAEPAANAKVLEDNVEKRPPADKPNTSLGRSSMLDDIELTLATLSTDTKKEVKEVHSEAVKTVEITEKKVISETEKTALDVTEKKAVVEDEIKSNVANVELNVAPVVVHAEKTVKEEIKDRALPSITTESISVEVKESTEVIKTKISDGLEIKKETEKKTIVTVNNGASQLKDVKSEAEDDIGTKFNSLTNDINEKKEVVESEEKKEIKLDNFSATKEYVGHQIQTKVTDVIEEAKESVKDKFGIASADEEKPKEVETKINGAANDLEKASNLLQDIASSGKTSPSPKTEVKIPPKVSPKPSPKMVLRPILTKSSAIPGSLSQESKEGVESPPEAKDEPASPTTPVSPTQAKSQSKIPMSKKTSAIPKLSLSSPKSSSVSPLSSPDSSTTKKVSQIPTQIHKEEEQIVDKVTELADKANEDLTHNNHESEERESKEKSPEPDKNSPFQRENRGSKSRLTKLRYSGRKSADSKSDESGSERGSRAGSEAKSEDGKKMAEDLSELDKSSRIPVRAGSKPRSSPPKALGD